MNDTRDLNIEELSNMIYFLTYIYPRIKDSKVGNFSYIKFAFDKNELDELKNILREKQLDITAINNSIKLLENDALYDESDECVIKIDDYKKFFILMNLLDKYYATFPNKYVTTDHLLETIWLRMSPNDVDDVYSFLKREIAFIRDDELFEDTKVECMDYNILYEISRNGTCFETNNHMQISLEKGSEIYTLPAIHYSVCNDGDDKVCYIYGIQNLGGEEKSEILKEYLKEDKKNIRKLNREYKEQGICDYNFSPDFVIALKLFIEFLKEKGISNIKVPSLQVYNYSFHEELSRTLYLAYNDYTEEDRIRLENLPERETKFVDVLDGSFDIDREFDEIDEYQVRDDYLHTKEQFQKFYNKQDMISKNKVERFLIFFKILEELYDDIDITSYPFMEDEDMNIKIKRPKKVKKIENAYF